MQGRPEEVNPAVVAKGDSLSNYIILRRYTALANQTKQNVSCLRLLPHTARVYYTS